MAQTIDGIPITNHELNNRDLIQDHPLKFEGTFIDIVIDAEGLVRLSTKNLFSITEKGDAKEIIPYEEAKERLCQALSDAVYLTPRTVVRADLVYYPERLDDLRFELKPIWVFTLSWFNGHFDDYLFHCFDAYTGDVFSIQ